MLLNLNLYELGILSALLTLFINYIIGKPGSEFSPYEIFSFYTVWLSKRRLKKFKLYKIYHEQYESSQAAKRTEFDADMFNYRMDYHKILYNAAEPYFTWERAVGMCSVCSGFWISLAVGLCVTFNFLSLVIIIVVSHIIIRILNKLL